MCIMTHTQGSLCIFSKKKTKNPLIDFSVYHKEFTSEPQQKYIAIDLSLLTDETSKVIIKWSKNKKIFFYGSAENHPSFINTINQCGYIPTYKTLSAASSAIKDQWVEEEQLATSGLFINNIDKVKKNLPLEEQISILFNQKIRLHFEGPQQTITSPNHYTLKHQHEGHAINVIIETEHNLSSTHEKWLYQFLNDWLQYEELNAILLQWKSIFNSLHEACFIADESYQILFKNKTSQDLQQKLQLNNIELSNQVFKNYKTNKSNSKPFKTQINYQDNDGFLKKCHLEIKIQKTLFNNRTFYTAIIKDITEVIILQQQILDLSKFSDAGIVGSSIAHEINNPLGGLISYLQLMQMSQKNPELLTELSELLSSAEQCKEIAKKLLSFSRKTDSSKFLKINFNTWAQSYFNKISEQYPDIQWQIDISKNTSHIFYETEALNTTFTGIIKNAVEAVANRPNKKNIKIIASENNKNCLIHIIDNGAGMDSNIQNQALNPFFTTKRGRENFGLGLTISYHLVRQSSGQLNFYSKPNVGTSVLVTFPRLDLNDQ